MDIVLLLCGGSHAVCTRDAILLLFSSNATVYARDWTLLSCYVLLGLRFVHAGLVILLVCGNRPADTVIEGKLLLCYVLVVLLFVLRFLGM